ncbi:putative membrane protein [Bradyrhizobium oligotrophicum S58]|uniref:Putative membrane protein n=1 Tax=Bradyrhizobium oligotrophicum S58 TaxID=1245469 RepID=M4ZGP3_9BRAD|nr:putative membrane protein [Bradyrhizobium oligotrophicum S58]
MQRATTAMGLDIECHIKGHGWARKQEQNEAEDERGTPHGGRLSYPAAAAIALVWAGLLH